MQELSPIRAPDTIPYEPRREAILQALAEACFDDEFYLLFQPQLSNRGHRLLTVEVLLRWRSPRLGLVNVSEFIPLAEQTGTVYRITRWVICRALRQLGYWQQQGIYMRMTINISMRDLEESQLYEQVCAETAANWLEPEYIGLEITETAPLRYSQKVARNIFDFQRAGYELVLDDYGAGFATLNTLRTLQVDTLKIDKSLVQQLEFEKINQLMVSSSIKLAHRLGLSVVAEGVESEFVCQWLTKLKCDFLQGFYISPPLAADELVARFFKP
ncbi:hypothetical protein CWE09_00740 [Aliidiomarina minuta]|uniref:EAL domain-containing protein n=1 Tax=Aliidiomarina minuta TaxID=880057 RepID=A0A432W5F0_9GAMM|nr:EAL domain-containing protein [Aliidiomarina minuta]RUO25295.1 hypothetical protein CWE09_00740 [Aliidiomarina minuta]